MDFELCIPCLFGLEGLVGNELRHMDMTNVRPENGRVYFNTDEAGLARANIRSRFGERVLLVMDRTVRLSGDTADYEINCSERTVKRYPKESGIALTIDLDKLPTMIAELSAINRKLGTLTVTTEMW